MIVRDANGSIIQGHATDPNKCLGPKASGTVFKKNPTAAEVLAGVVDITGWLDIVFYSDAPTTVTYNGDAAKVEPATSGVPLVIHPAVTQIVINFDTTYVTGM